MTGKGAGTKKASCILTPWRRKRDRMRHREALPAISPSSPLLRHPFPSPSPPCTGTPLHCHTGVLRRRRLPRHGERGEASRGQGRDKEGQGQGQEAGKARARGAWRSGLAYGLHGAPQSSPPPTGHSAKRATVPVLLCSFIRPGPRALLGCARRRHPSTPPGTPARPAPRSRRERLGRRRLRA